MSALNFDSISQSHLKIWHHTLEGITWNSKAFTLSRWSELLYSLCVTMVLKWKQMINKWLGYYSVSTKFLHIIITQCGEKKSLNLVSTLRTTCTFTKTLRHILTIFPSVPVSSKWPFHSGFTIWILYAFFTLICTTFSTNLTTFDLILTVFVEKYNIRSSLNVQLSVACCHYPC